MAKNMLEQVCLHLYSYNDPKGRQLELLYEPQIDWPPRFRFSFNSNNGAEIELSAQEIESLERHFKSILYLINEREIEFGGYSSHAMKMRSILIDGNDGGPGSTICWEFLYEPKRIKLSIRDYRDRKVGAMFMAGSKVMLMHDLARLWKEQIRAMPDQPVLEEGEFYE